MFISYIMEKLRNDVTYVAMTYLKIGMTYRVGFYFMTSALMEASVSPLCERVRI